MLFRKDLFTRSTVKSFKSIVEVGWDGDGGVRV